MTSKKYVKHFFKVIYLHSVWGVESPTKFSKKGPDRISIFRGGLLEKRGDFFEQGERDGSQLLHKKLTKT